MSGVVRAVFGVACLVAGRAWAHEVLYSVEYDKAVVVRAYYPTGQPMAYAQYEVHSPSDTQSPWQMGRTDRNGYLSFVSDQAGRWRVKVSDASGHGLDIEVETAAPSEQPAGLSIPHFFRPLFGAILIALIFVGLWLFYRSKAPSKAVVVAAAVLLGPGLAKAHHGAAAIGAAGPEGPGAAIETSSALPLRMMQAYFLLRSEFVSFERLSHADPENKRYSLFNNLVLGYGLRPFANLYVFVPFNLKQQDNVGTNFHLGDLGLMATLALKWDEGLRLVPSKESLDELMDWHFAIYGGFSLPTGPSDTKRNETEAFSPDMQTGFGAPSLTVGLAATKQVSEVFTYLAEVNYLYFFPHSYTDTQYQFGSETRINNALSVRVFGQGNLRADLVGEVLFLHLKRDRERDAETGNMLPVRASGGAIFYGALGIRLTYGIWSLALGAKRAFLSILNEKSEQQGSEGLENVRVTASIAVSPGF